MDAENFPRARIAAARTRVAEAAEELRRLRRQLRLARQSEQRLQSAVRGREPEERVLLLIAVATRLEPCTATVSIVARALLRSWRHARKRRGNLGLADRG